MLYDQNPDPKQDENSSSGDSFSFLKETIKPKPVSREKIFMQLLRMAIYGVIIGMFALTITARKMAHVAWHHLYQRKEPRV